MVTFGFGPFGIVHRSVLSSGVSASAFRLYVALATFADNNGEAFPSKGTMESLGCGSRSTITAALGELIRANLVQRVPQYREDGGQSSSLYVLTPLPEFRTPPAENLAPPPAGISAPPIIRTNKPRKNQEKVLELPENLKSVPGFEEEWKEWIQYRKESGRKPYTSTGLKATFARLSQFGNPVGALNFSRSMGYQGVFEDTSQPKTRVQSTKAAKKGISEEDAENISR